MAIERSKYCWICTWYPFIFFQFIANFSWRIHCNNE